MSDTQRITRAGTRESARRAQSNSPSSSRRGSISLHADAIDNDDEKGAGQRAAASPGPGDRTPSPGTNPMSEMNAMRQQMADMMAMMQQQQQRHQQEIASLKQQHPSPQESHRSASQPSPAPSAAIPMNNSATPLQPPDWMVAMQHMQQQNAAQLLMLQALGELRAFNPKGGDTTLAAQEWLRDAENYFASREEALGIDATAGDRARVLLSVKVLSGDAARWWASTPGAVRPTTWTTFVEAVRKRYCSVPDERLRVAHLHDLVEVSAKIREKLTLANMQAFTTKFAQLAGEVPDDYLTAHSKLALLARGLPLRYAELVLREDAKRPPPPLHEIITMVLSRAAAKENASSSGVLAAGSSSIASLNAVNLAAEAFGWTPEEAALHMQEGEGWAPHDTGSTPAVYTGAAAAASAAQPLNQLQSLIEQNNTKLLAQFTAKFGNGAGSKGQSQRRNVPAGVRDSVPEGLANGRKEAGLCIKCGIAKYEPGNNGHNSRTCRAKADSTTTVVEGKKKAGF